MNILIFPYDYIIIVIFIIIIIFSFLKGFIQSILGLLTWIGSILITIYSYNNLSNFLTKQFLKINFFQLNEYLTNIFSLIIAIPIIFLFSLFVLKKIRKFISNDLNNNFLGLIFDKFFGVIYGIVFSYILLTALIIVSNRFEFQSIYKWINYNSTIITNVNKFNIKYKISNIYLIEEKLN